MLQQVWRSRLIHTATRYTWLSGATKKKPKRAYKITTSDWIYFKNLHRHAGTWHKKQEKHAWSIKDVRLNTGKANAYVREGSL